MLTHKPFYVNIFQRHASVHVIPADAGILTRIWVPVFDNISAFAAVIWEHDTPFSRQVERSTCRVYTIYSIDSPWNRGKIPASAGMTRADVKHLDISVYQCPSVVRRVVVSLERLCSKDSSLCTSLILSWNFHHCPEEVWLFCIVVQISFWTGFIPL